MIIDLPYQDIIDQTSGPSSEGFELDTIRYSGKIAQRTFSGPSVEASRTEIWKIHWKLLQASVDGNPVDYDISVVRDFYKQAQLGFVRWKPFEIAQTRIWRVVENSLSVKNVSGCNFTASLDLEFLYSE